MFTLAVFGLCQAGVVPWWTLWLAFSFDMAATIGMTIAITAAGSRHEAGQQLGSSVAPSRPGPEYGFRDGFEELIEAGLRRQAELEKRGGNSPEGTERRQRAGRPPPRPTPRDGEPGHSWT
jgi:hypothetical protein